MENKNLIPCNELPPPYSFEQMLKDLGELGELIDKKLENKTHDETHKQDNGILEQNQPTIG